MRNLLAVLACGIGVVSILLTGRYGYKQADLEVDRWIAAIMFGSISLCAFFFKKGNEKMAQKQGKSCRR